jgi:phosphatidate cytidylyltransferase
LLRRRSIAEPASKEEVSGGAVGARRSASARRLVTSAVAVPLALLATFRLPNLAFFVFVLLIFGTCSVEYAQLLRRHTPRAPLWVVPVGVPVAATLFFWAFSPTRSAAVMTAAGWALGGGALLTVGLGTLLLLARTPPPEVPAALGAIAVGIPYFALPAAVAGVLQRLDPWLLFLLYAIVWLGDTAAYYCGSAWGRHKMAPVVSPNKSWEGAVAGFVTGIFATVVWSFFRLGEVRLPLLLVAAVTAVAAQLGDLFESLLKRGVNVKDSGHGFPGHGGFLDRMDAMLFAGPVMLGGLWLIAHDGVGL